MGKSVDGGENEPFGRHATHKSRSKCVAHSADDFDGGPAQKQSVPYKALRAPRVLFAAFSRARRRFRRRWKAEHTPAAHGGRTTSSGRGNRSSREVANLISSRPRTRPSPDFEATQHQRKSYRRDPPSVRQSFQSGHLIGLTRDSFPWTASQRSKLCPRGSRSAGSEYAPFRAASSSI